MKYNGARGVSCNTIASRRRGEGKGEKNGRRRKAKPTITLSSGSQSF